MGESLGLVLKNPFNLEHGTQPWIGEMKTSHPPFCQFDNVEHGLRAGYKNLIAAYYRHNRTTVRAIITAYAPPSENDTEAYVQAVASEIGMLPGQELPILHDKPLDQQSVFIDLGAAIIHHEQGQQPFTDEQLQQAIVDAES